MEATSGDSPRSVDSVSESLAGCCVTVAVVRNGDKISVCGRGELGAHFVSVVAGNARRVFGRAAASLFDSAGFCRNNDNDKDKDDNNNDGVR